MPKRQICSNFKENKCSTDVWLLIYTLECPRKSGSKPEVELIRPEVLLYLVLSQYDIDEKAPETYRKYRYLLKLQFQYPYQFSKHHEFSFRAVTSVSNVKTFSITSLHASRGSAVEE